MFHNRLKDILLSSLVLCFIAPMVVHAHEVYVLDNASITKDIALPSINLFKVILSNEYLFLISLFIGIFCIVFILGISISRKVENRIDPILFKIKPYAGHIAQATLGLALLASAYFGALFGTELPLQSLFGAYSQLITIGLYIAGGVLVFGIFPRGGAVIALVIYIIAFIEKGTYMISYMTYFGEALVVMLFGGGYAMLTLKHPWNSGNLIMSIQKRKHFILRVAFGSSLIYAAFYAKLIHGNLALDTVNQYHLTNYFHFNPLFIVLGAFMVEMMIAIFYLIGFEIRFTSLLFLGFLTASLIFFGETVWPHLILIGTAIAMLVHGYDEYTIEHPWYKKGEREPVL